MRDGGAGWDGRPTGMRCWGGDDGGLSGPGGMRCCRRVSLHMRRSQEWKDLLGTEVEHNRQPWDRRHREEAVVALETHAVVPAGQAHGQDQEGGQRVVVHKEDAEEEETANAPLLD